MAGHSKFKNIMHRKGAQDKKRAKAFTKILKEISVAAKIAPPDPDSNPRLRLAMLLARNLNVPKDKIDAAIKRASNAATGENYEQIRYEGYGPYGIAFIIEALSDNRNRTASEIRSTFTKYGGNLGESGSVSYMFTQQGAIVFSKEICGADIMLDIAIEAGADDCIEDAEHYIIYCEFECIHDVQLNIESALSDSEQFLKSADIIWRPDNLISLSKEHMQSISKLYDALQEIDDVQEVYHNALKEEN